MAGLGAEMGLVPPELAGDVAGSRFKAGLVTLIDTKNPNDKGASYDETTARAMLAGTPGRYRVVQTPGNSVSVTANVDARENAFEKGMGKWESDEITQAQNRLRTTLPDIRVMQGLMSSIGEYGRNATGVRLLLSQIADQGTALLVSDPNTREQLSAWFRGLPAGEAQRIKTQMATVIAASIKYVTGEKGSRVTDKEREITAQVLALDKLWQNDPVSAIASLSELSKNAAVVRVSDMLRAGVPVHNIYDDQGAQAMLNWLGQTFGLPPDPSVPVVQQALNDIATVYNEFEALTGRPIKYISGYGGTQPPQQ